ncbi:YdiU family protein [Paraconexibacter antarcticus]|uniref:Protein nucleotidyltransferase YdiU n=1 Tax=Paraconexibacter antarcticus TaxID=2949664 RepID=A0ABY5DW73_9ACTN|nr:YdiU family protein [Paraconexibacter antarcticus]UTI64932.1 YdiU family protein [Paraconexibacter antarcticus]
MSSAAPPLLLPFAEATYVRDLAGLFVAWEADAAPAPELLVLNDALVRVLGGDPDALRTPAGVGLLLGSGLPDGHPTVAQGYAGHQFGGWSPRLGDGRALLLGEVIDAGGVRRDVHLKGSGRTPFARGGDGKAAVGPMLREHLVSEAMHALGVPTTRALAVVATGETVRRETPLPGAVLARVAASHLRVGTFQYVAATLRDGDLLRRLAEHAIARHHPDAAAADRPALALLDAVVAAQAALIARWMHVGFVHGVMNTDNMTISGETIDYGPCAFMDAYDPGTVFSSIDHGGRYAYGSQPAVAQWNLARLAEALLPLIGDDQESAVAAVMPVLEAFPDRFAAAWRDGMHAKLGLADGPGDEESLVDGLLTLLGDHDADWTSAFRALAGYARGDGDALTGVVAAPAAFADWLRRWTALGPDPDAMDRVNPLYIPRNHLVEDALAQATAGDLGPYRRLLDAVTRPFEARAGLEAYARPSGDGGDVYVTYCGT